MGLMDRFREQASQVAQRTAQVTQEAAQQGKAKFDQAQAKRRADGGPAHNKLDAIRVPADG